MKICISKVMCASVHEFRYVVVCIRVMCVRMFACVGGLGEYVYTYV